MIRNQSLRMSRRKAVWGPKVVTAVAVAVLALGSTAYAADGHRQHAAGVRAGHPNSNVKPYRLDGELTKRSARALGALNKTRVIVDLNPGAKLPASFKQYAKRNGELRILNSVVLDVPNGQLKALAAHPDVARVHFDRPATKHDYRTVMATGSRAAQRALGYTGRGIGVAVIDSGIASWHDDLTSRTSAQYPYGNQRVTAFVDFVNGQATPYDDDGHGTHVAGIIAGNGFDSNGKEAGVAPEADLVVLKALDANGSGTISGVIQALDWVLANHAQYNIRIVNLSIGSNVQESYWTDPLTLAAKRVADAGIVVVAAAGNGGNNAQGQPQYGAIGSPANAPWVLTVGASSTMGTITRDDDTMASFSSRGPTYMDWAAKPDIVAPGVGTVSLASPGSNFYVTKAAQLLPGSVDTASMPYLSLSGTSMSAPVVSGTVALMLQANPNLSPNAVKAILQYTAQDYNYDPLSEGAGFLNAVGAVRLARFYATAAPGAPMPSMAMWSKRIVWGNHLMTGGILDPSANAFGLGTTWGVAKTDAGDNIVWGTSCGDSNCDNIVWGTERADNIVWGTSGDGDNIVWGTAIDGDNIVWGTDCGGADCDNIVWGTIDGDNIVWGTARDGDNIVWGTAGLDGDNIVWGTMIDGDNIVWGTVIDGDNIVWGTMADGDNIVWGTYGGGDNIVWGTSIDGDNIVWGTAIDGDNIVWGTADNGDNIVWGTYSGGDNIVWGTGDTGAVLWDATVNGPVNWQTLRQLFARLSDEQVFGAIVALTSPAPVIDTTPVVVDAPVIVGDSVVVTSTDPIVEPVGEVIVSDPLVVPLDPETIPLAIEPVVVMQVVVVVEGDL